MVLRGCLRRTILDNLPSLLLRRISLYDEDVNVLVLPLNLSSSCSTKPNFTGNTEAVDSSGSSELTSGKCFEAQIARIVQTRH